jgi:hypothetical protein
MRVRVLLVLCAIALPAATAGVLAQLPAGAEHEAIAYSKTTPADAIARLQRAIDGGEVTLEFDQDRGYLPAVLKRLDIPVASQGFVFSRTSLQVDRITPWTPRAVYFNDDVYVGWVQGGPIVEIASVDPTLGAVFYTLDQQPAARPVFHRQTHTCLQCHDSSSSTGGVPGLIVRSVFTDRYGYPVASGPGATTDQTPIEDRWGGWYVTGTAGGALHLGNTMAPALAHELGNAAVVVAKKDGPFGAAVRRANSNVTDLRPRFDTDPYLSPHSDAVALMVLTHQAYVHNLITNAGYEARKAMFEGETSSEGPRIRSAAERLVRGLLFSKEAPLASPIAGTSAFAAEFAARGPRDSKGRSLRQLDLEHRLFKYPLSYLIYSDSFDALPQLMKQRVYQRMRQILGGQDATPDFAHLASADRSAIVEILADTKPEILAAVPSE